MITPAMIRVLVADDHSIVREGLVALLRRKRNVKVVAEADNGYQAVQQFRRYHPDVCLIDLRMPHMDGLEAIQSIRKIDPNAKIIVLTTFDDDEDIYRAMDYGAKAYLLKDISSKDMLEIIARVFSGMMVLPANVCAKLTSRAANSRLTSRELDVLHLLTAGKSNKQIGAILDLTEGTIKIHVSHILRKLKATGRTHAARIAWKRGLIHPD